MVYKLYRIASRVATLNAFLKSAERKVLFNTFQKARSNSTVAWPPPNLFRNYQKFQTNDGVPVHLKAGFGDRALYGATIVMIALGLMDGMYTLLGMAYPKKKA